MLLMMTGITNKHANHHHRNHILQLLLVISETEGETEQMEKQCDETGKGRERSSERGEESERSSVKEEEKEWEAVKEEEKEGEAVREEEEKWERGRGRSERGKSGRRVREEEEEVRREEEEVRREEEVRGRRGRRREEARKKKERSEEKKKHQERGQTEGEEDRFNRFHLALKIGGIHQMSQIFHHVNHCLDLLEILGLKLFQQNPTVLWSYFNCSFIVCLPDHNTKFKFWHWAPGYH